jgi:hypothetical protein
MSSKLFGPANMPLFDVAPTRGQTKVTRTGRVVADPWSYSSVVAPAADTNFPKMVASFDVDLYSITVALQVASAVNYVVELIVNGGIVKTTTLIAGQTEITETVVASVLDGQFWWPRLKAAASGDGEMMSIVATYAESGT